MLSNKYDFKKAEQTWQKMWQDEQIYRFDPDSAKIIYSIDTPPPTVNGNIHIGHIFSYSQAEIIARYKRMCGYNVFYPFGFDDNGLPTERLVEKKYKIRAHQLPREEFTELCLQTTAEFEEQFQQLFMSAGFSTDWGLQYSTISPRAQLTSQKSFIDLYKKGKAYYSDSPALWCPECRTSVAQAEVEAKELETNFVYLKFRLVDTGEEFIIATTRPELLPGCVSIFINPNNSEYSHLTGKKAIVPIFGFEVPIMADEKVSEEKGSGIVMCCTFGDQTDIEWWRKYNLPLKKVIARDGTIEADIPTYGGMKVEVARKQIIEELSQGGYVLKIEKIKHNVSTHERCCHAMEYTIAKQWFIRIVDQKEKFIEAGNAVNWHPAHMKERYMMWVKNIMWDWCISRQRYFGVPFPVWYCKECGEVIIAEESELPINPLTSMPKKACKCGCTEFIPETDVMDTWATSSMTSFINSGWATDDEMYKKLMPMSMRPNAHEIIRTWDFYTIIKSIYHCGMIPWNDIMISGFVLASKGEKISKSKGNSKIEPEDLLNKYSADVVRYWCANGRLGSDIAFSEDELRNGTKFITKLFNASKFALMHLQDYQPTTSIELLPMDRWILTKLAKLSKELNGYLDQYEIGLGLNAIEKFFWDFCDNYIEIVKTRLYNPEIYGDEARLSVQTALYTTLLNLLKFMAPYFPHITEEIYQSYFREKEGRISIHSLLFDDLSGFADNEIMEEAEFAKSIIFEARKFKSENNLSMKEPLTCITITDSASKIDCIKKFECDIKATCKCEEIRYICDEASKSITIE